MNKKLLSSTLMLLTLSPVAAGVVTQATMVSADTTTSGLCEKSNLRDIHGSFGFLFTKPHQYLTAYAGNYDVFVGNGIKLDVANGGPESLSWSAMVYNKRTGKQVLKDWVEFKHGDSTMSLYFDKSADIKVGDSFDVVFTNNNYVGPSQIGGFIWQL